MIFEVNTVAKQKQALLVMIFLFLQSFHYPQLFYYPSCPTAVPAYLEKTVHFSLWFATFYLVSV